MPARDIILTGAEAAAELLRDVDARARFESGGRVSVFDLPALLHDHGGVELPLVFQPLDGLLGAFFPRPTPGLLVTTQPPLSVQRFTAAHEIGHAFMRHQPSFDGEDILRRPANAIGGADRQEGEANAFASALLLPHWLLRSHQNRQGWTSRDLADGATIYQLGLRVGLSYAATCMALFHYKKLSTSVYRRLVEEQPKQFKRLLLSDLRSPPATWWGDVWHLTERDTDAHVEGTLGDHLVIDLVENAAAGYLWDASPLWELGLVKVEDRQHRLDPENAIGGPVLRRIIARCDRPAKGVVELAERRPWEAIAVHTRLRLMLNFSEPIRAGEWTAIRHRHASPAGPTLAAA